MSSDYETTPTAESKTPFEQSNPENSKINLPWARLYATIRNLQSLDLINNSYVFGRNVEGIDVTIPKKAIPENKYANISKKHFEIVKVDGEPVVVIDYSKNGTFINGKLVGRNKKRIIRNDDKISVGFACLTVYIYKEINTSEDNFLSPTLKEKYVTSHILGRGACGEVRLAYELNTCERFAIKKIVKNLASTSRGNPNHPNRIKNEINILKSLSHDCIVQIIEIDETEESFFIVLEYLEGGELTNRILTIESLPESTTKFLFYQIALAVQYLHSQGIIHRDLKPQNVLLVSEATRTQVKVTDFGLSKIINDETFLKTKCGTPYYLAPEVWVNPVYDKKVDVWSVGVILYYMFAKELPFIADNTNDLCKLVVNGNYNFNGKVWGRVSKEAIDLIKKMLTVNPNERLSIDEVLSHEWLEKDLNLQYDVAKLLNYIPESSSSGCSDEEPPIKKFHFLVESKMISGIRSWP